MNKKVIWFLIGVGLLVSFGSTFATQDIMEVMFAPSKAHEGIVDLGATKDAVWNEVFKSSTQVWLTDNLWAWCFVNNQSISQKDIQTQMANVKYTWSEKDFCEKILWWDNNKSVISTSTQAPLIVRITKFLLRMTIVLSITMVLYNGVLWIIESSKWSEVKDAKNNIIYIFVWILLSLSSVALINLISSLGVSSLDPASVINKEVSTVVNTSNSNNVVGGSSSSSDTSNQQEVIDLEEQKWTTKSKYTELQ